MATFIVVHVPRSRAKSGTRSGIGGRIGAPPSDAHLQLDRVWLVESAEMADEIRDRLSEGLPPEDALVVLKVGDEAAWRGLADEQAEWLVNHL